MLVRTCLGSAALLALALPSANVHAAPTGNVSGLRPATEIVSPYEAVAWRRCWVRHGVRHCRWTDGSRSRGYYGYRPHYPEAYRTGSSRWWQEMDRQDRGGRGRQ